MTQENGQPGCANTVSVLVVDDNPADEAWIRASLAELGKGTPVHPWFHVRVVRDAAHAVDVLVTALHAIADAEGSADSTAMPVVLLDLNRPDGHGMEALRLLRGVAPDAPVVVLTALDDDGVALDAMRHGAQEYLVKGRADGDALVRALRHALARKRAEEVAAHTQWLAGIGETAIAIRHEVNNPLQALMLNVELMRDAVPDERAELEQSVLESARRIAEVLKRLERIHEPRSVPYVGGERMLDLGAEGKPRRR